jgi:hypothetical protein
LGNYQFSNCSIAGVRDLTFNGQAAGFMVTIKGYYQINANLWSS